MSTRFYLRAAEVPSVSPAFHTAWDSTVGAVRRTMYTTKLAGDTVTSASSSQGGPGDQILIAQFVSLPLDPGTTLASGGATAKAMTFCLEGNGNDDLIDCATARVCSQDGTTIQHELYGSSLISGQGSGEWPFTGFPAQSRSFIGGVTSGTYVTQSGDRLVLELGYEVGGAAIPGVAGSVRIGSDSTGVDVSSDGDTSLTKLGWFETSAGVTFFAPLNPGGWGTWGVGRKTRIAWTVDGRTASLMDWQADAAADWGDRTLTGSVPESVSWAEEGAPIVGWRSTDDAMWSGTLETVRLEDDLLKVRAYGGAEALMRNQTRMFYRIDGADRWSDSETDPHSYNNSEKFDVTLGRGHIMWKVGDGDTAYAVGNQSAVVLWVEGGLITRYSIQVEPDINFANLEVETHNATGPSGSRTLEGTHSLAAIGGTPTTYARTLTTPADLLSLRMIADGAFTPAARHRVKVNAIKVYGRTIDDAFSISEVVEDVAGVAGLVDAGITANTTAALPLDWNEDLPGLLSYMAELADWRWLVTHDGLSFGPFAKTWEAFTSADATTALEPERRYNRVRVPYRAVSGALRTSEGVPSVDPFPDERVTWVEELEDPQADSTLADAFAQAQADYFASARLRGSLTPVRVRYRGEIRTPYDVRAGDLLSMPDLAPEIGAQRIQTVTYRPGENVTVELGAGFNVVRTLAEIERDRPRRRRRRRPTRGPT